MHQVIVRNSALHYGRHPITGEPMGPADKTCADAVGTVKRCVQDRTGVIVLEYEDGHLFVIRYDHRSGDLVTTVYQPEVVN